RHRLRAPPPHLHRRPLRPELPPYPRAALELRVLVGLGLDPRNDGDPARVLPLARLGRRRSARAAEAAAAPHARPAAAETAARIASLASPGYAVLHLPELQGALGRPRPARGARRRPGRLPPLRLRLSLRADGRLLPRAERGHGRLRPGRACARLRPRRLRADRLLGGGAFGARRRREP